MNAELLWPSEISSVVLDALSCSEESFSAALETLALAVASDQLQSVVQETQAKDFGLSQKNFELLASLGYGFFAEGNSTEIVPDAADAAAQTLKEYASAEGIPLQPQVDLSARMRALLEAFAPVEAERRTREVMGSFERLFRGATIRPQLRPVPSRGESRDFQKAVIVLDMRLEFFNTRRETETIHIGLDLEDIGQLKGVLEDAEHWARLLAQQLADAPFNIVFEP